MEPCKEKSKITPHHAKEERKRLFGIVKLEERIAPKCTTLWRYGKHCGH